MSAGVAYINLGEYEKAVADFTRAIELNPNFAEAYNYRGFAYMKLNKKAQADADAAKAENLGYIPK